MAKTRCPWCQGRHILGEEMPEFLGGGACPRCEGSGELTEEQIAAFDTVHAKRDDDIDLSVFERHGFGGHAIDFSFVKPEVIEAMAQALLALEQVREGDVFITPDGREVAVEEIEPWVTYGRGSHTRLSSFLGMVKLGRWKRKER